MLRYRTVREQWRFEHFEERPFAAVSFSEYFRQETGVKDGPYIPEAVQLCVKAGDAAVFPHALSHGVVANRSEQPRKTLIYCYSHQCFRAFDYEKASPELMARCTPRQRRLIGDIGKSRDSEIPPIDELCPNQFQ